MHYFLNVSELHFRSSFREDNALDDASQTVILEPEAVTEEDEANVNQNESPVINETEDDVAAAPSRVIALFFYNNSFCFF